MTAGEIYRKALDSLGYSDSQAIQRKAVTVINQVYDDIFDAAQGKEYKPITSLSGEINLTEPRVINAFVYGVAEKLALGEGDGELQQYFLMEYRSAKAKLTRIEKVKSIWR